MHLFQAAQLFTRLLEGLLGHARTLDAPLVLLDLLALFIQFTQLFMDGTHLFAQEIVPLALGNLIFDIRLDLGLHGRQLDFARKQFVDLMQTIHRIDQFDDLLGLFDFQPKIGGDQIGQFTGFIDAFENAVHIPGKLTAQSQNLFGIFPDVAHERFDLQIGFHIFRLFQYLNRYPEIISFLEVPHDPRLGETLHQCLDASIRQLEDPQNPADGTHPINISLFWILDCRVLLGGHEQKAVFGNSRINGAHGFFATDEKGQQHIGKNHHVAHRQQRQRRWHLEVSGVLFYYTY